MIVKIIKSDEHKCYKVGEIYNVEKLYFGYTDDYVIRYNLENGKRFYIDKNDCVDITREQKLNRIVDDSQNNKM